VNGVRRFSPSELNGHNIRFSYKGLKQQDPAPCRYTQVIQRKDFWPGFRLRNRTNSPWKLGPLNVG
jgi:hypothetical protein